MSVDEIIRCCTVRLSANSEPSIVLGSGVLLRQENLQEKIYILTAAHCLENNETETIPDSIKVEVYNPNIEEYQAIVVTGLAQKTTLLKEGKQDVAVIQIDEACILSISPELPCIPIVQYHAKLKQYKCAGFPIGNNNNYDAFIAARIDEQTAEHRLTYSTVSTYTDTAAEGFSGGGIFSVTRGEVLLEAVMTNYRLDEKGGMLFGTDFYQINEKLASEHKPQVYISYAVAEGVTEKSIRDTLDKTYDNLGKRFLPTFNVDAAIQDQLDAVSRSPKFYERCDKAIDQWISDGSFIERGGGKIYRMINSLQDDVIRYARDLRSYDKIDFAPYERSAKEILDYLEKEDASLVQAYQKSDVTNRKSIADSREEIIRLRRYCTSLSFIPHNTDIELSNTNFLVVHGEAGCGKSHLFGYFSKETTKKEQNSPAILLLGGNIFLGRDVTENILSQLGAECSFDDLIEGLEMLGRQKGRRIPIMIDALNETKDMVGWQTALPGLVQTLSHHPYIALIVSVRDTFLNDVITETYQTDWKKAMREHKGFEEGEFQAVQRFCEYYELETIKVPTLNPEFSNPLYLHIACQIAKESGEKSLPVGWSVDLLFGKYASKLDRDFEGIREREYKNKHIVTKAIGVLASKMCEIKRTYMSYDDCDELLQTEFPAYPSLLNDLLESSLLSKGFDYNHGEDVYFTYQRMGDYYIATNIIEGCKTKADAQKRLQSYSSILLDKLFFEGVLEQLFILIPERYGEEIWRLINLKKEYRSVRMLLHSLRWRSVESIHEQEIIAFLKKEGVTIDRWWSTLLYLSPIPNHPFNGDRWNRMMKRFKSMAERDAYLQPYILETTWVNSSDNDIQRLVDWAWTPGISRTCDDEVARLVGVTLVWMLSSTIHALRNSTTKALVNLLQHKPKVLLSILQDLEDVDDAYIQERLVAVTYGCVLRCEQKEAVCEIAKWVYNKVFSKGNPPRHILLRDSACNIIDYACKKCGLKGVNAKKYLPPYNAEMPVLPEESEIEKYKLDYNDKTEKYAYVQNAILRSLYGGVSDFGDKIVEPSINNFVPWSFREEAELQSMIRHCEKTQREMLKLYIEERKLVQDNAYRGELKSLLGSLLDISREILQQHLSEQDLNRLENVLIPNHALVHTSHYRNRRNSMPYRYWVVQRVFELGYDRKKHGQYDTNAQTREGHLYSRLNQTGRIERLGKKYQWIAYYELLGCLADNYYIENPWNTTEDIPYDGAWQDYLRDIDPVCITKRNPEVHVESWMEYVPCMEWNLPPQKWLRDTFTIDEIRHMLIRTDNNGKQWYTLHDDKTHHPPKKLGESPYHYNSFFDYQIMAYLIRKEDKHRFIDLAGESNFLHFEMARPVDSSLRYIAREKYWSRACKIDECETADIWKTLHNKTDLEVIVPYVAMSGNCDEDFMATNAWYAMPIKEIFEGMHLEYGEIDGDLIQEGGELVATCNPNTTRHYLMQRGALNDYLSYQGWDIIWVVNMERYYSTNANTFMGAKVWQHSGLFYVDDNGEIQGKMKIQDRNVCEDTSDTDVEW